MIGLLLLASTVAAAPLPCEQTGPRAEGPITVGYFEADVATGRRTCPRTELALAAGGGAVIDTPNFYGSIAGGALLSGSYALGDRTELFGTLEAVRFQYVQNASLKGSALSLGHFTVGATHVFLSGEAYASGTSVRLLLPTSTASPHAHPLGAALGQTLTWSPGPSWLELHAFAGADVSAALSAGAAYPRVGALLTVGAQVEPWRWLGIVLDVTGRWGDPPYVAPSLALRFGIGRSAGLELAGSLPVAGTDRHDGLGMLRFSWRF